MPIEELMLRSIGRTLDWAGLKELDLPRFQKLPPLDQLMNEVGFNRALYVVTARMKAHDVHGTWTSLVTNYLVREGDKFSISAEEIAPRAIQYIGVSLLVLQALSAFAQYFFKSQGRDEFEKLLNDATSKIEALNKRLAADDFKISDKGNS
jgi:hypothetical protein